MNLNSLQEDFLLEEARERYFEEKEHINKAFKLAGEFQ